MHWRDDQKAEARTIVTRVEKYQQLARLNDVKLLRQFPDLGSAKTWRQRLLAEDYANLHPDRTLAKLRRIAVVLDGGLPDHEFFKLPFTQEVLARVGLLERSTTDRRILVALAPNGCGKTTVAKWCVAQNPGERAYIRLRPGHRNKQLHIMNHMLAGLGLSGAAGSKVVGEAQLIAALTQPRTVFLDQAHEGGPAVMHLLRCLVDETPSRFVYIGYDTAFRRVLAADSDTTIEAQAFLGRCLKPIFNAYKAGTAAVDVKVFLQETADMDASVAAGVANKLTTLLQRTTNLRLLADAVDIARAESDSDAVEPEAVVRACVGLAGLDPKSAAKMEAEVES